MPKIVLTIFKMGDQYRALIKIGENAEPTANGRTVYQDGGEVNGIADRMDLIEKMKKKAQDWARKQGIPFVDNIDFNPYY